MVRQLFRIYKIENISDAAFKRSMYPYIIGELVNQHWKMNQPHSCIERVNLNSQIPHTTHESNSQF